MNRPAHILLFLLVICMPARADYLRDLQFIAEKEEKAIWAHWGNDRNQYTQWQQHSNRLIPIYTFGMSLKEFTGKRSAYRARSRLKLLYGSLPKKTLNRRANYMDQTDVYRLQKQALASGKKNIILLVFDGMDWQTTQAAAIYKTQEVGYTSGRGTGLFFQDYRGTETDYGYFVSSPHNNGTEIDVDAQTVINPGGTEAGGYSAELGGPTPWAKPRSDDYLLGKEPALPHIVTDSSASATSMVSGIKTYNGAVNVDFQGNHVKPIARELQERGFSIGMVTNVPLSHATPACAYANNVTRNDYQDLTRDLIGLPSISHRKLPLPGVDVLLGSGWGLDRSDDEDQGQNFVGGNRVITDADLEFADVKNGGKYHIATRTPGKTGKDILLEATNAARDSRGRLLGFFGTKRGHLPYQTADGKSDPIGYQYSEEELLENPTLADMTSAALDVLSSNKTGFWLMIEAGDIDWANHGNNIDNSIGSVLSGDDAFRAVIRWVEQTSWDDTVVILTADHGHYFVLDAPEALVNK